MERDRRRRKKRRRNRKTTRKGFVFLVLLLVIIGAAGVLKMTKQYPDYSVSLEMSFCLILVRK